jgi:hypothetical protein
MMRWIVGFAAAAGLVLAGSPAVARPFILLRAAGSWIVIDRSAIEKAGDIRRGAVVTVQSNILDGSPPQPGYVRTTSEYDCGKRDVRWRSFSAFSRTGSLLVRRDNPQNDWAPASASAETLAALRVVCGEFDGDAAISANGIADVVIALLQAYDPAPAPAEAASPAKPEAPKAKPAAAKPAAAQPRKAKPR